MSDVKHIDKTSSETKSIGFDYQYYFFLWKLLSLKPGQSVGLEVKDDVHTELNNNIQIFYQLKHTIQKNKAGEIINLTASDTDFWKTLSNWCNNPLNSQTEITDKNCNFRYGKTKMEQRRKAQNIGRSKKRGCTNHDTQIWCISSDVLFMA